MRVVLGSRRPCTAPPHDRITSSTTSLVCFCTGAKLSVFATGDDEELGDSASMSVQERISVSLKSSNLGAAIGEKAWTIDNRSQWLVMRTTTNSQKDSSDDHLVPTTAIMVENDINVIMSLYFKYLKNLFAKQRRPNRIGPSFHLPVKDPSHLG